MTAYLTDILRCWWCEAPGWPSASWHVSAVPNGCGDFTWLSACCPVCAEEEPLEDEL